MAFRLFLFTVQDSRQALLYGVAAAGQPIVRIDEICIVGVVLLVWAAAVYVFFNQWGKTFLNS
jgi:succinate dehydrogenase/fumarate reductase cytochrome b subunit